MEKQQAFGKNKIKKTILAYFKKVLHLKSDFILKAIRILYGDYIIQNINYDYTGKQSTILICYTTKSFELNFNENKIFHSNILHINQIIKILIDMNFSIDVCNCNDMISIEKIKNKKYDYILGFGKAYELLVNNKQYGKSILFITENDPEIANNNYQERINYFKSRHPKKKISNAIIRNNYYNMNQLVISDIGIAINSDYNCNYMKKRFNTFYSLNINGLSNSDFVYTTDHIIKKRNSFVWFGSRGVIHKGLDILVDTFALMPHLNLNIYGISEEEINLIQQNKPNINIHSKIHVMDPEFIRKVVLENVFVVSLSCSEGMQSAIATCMLHGLIPIVTKETGYNSHDSILEFSDYTIDSVRSTLTEICNYSDDLIIQLSKSAYIYANENFTLGNFTNNIRGIFNRIFY
jgi:hypothetical protein